MKSLQFFWVILWGMTAPLFAEEAASRYFEIQVIDQATKRGVPLVELVTVDGVRYVTDNAGRIAYFEPGHAGRTIFFSVFPQGYRVPKDGFGIEGVRLKIEPGKSATIALERLNVAERLYRCTGQGLYRDSVLLGHKTPLAEPLGSGQVAGQDSIQSAVYRGKLYWFWGDTSRLSYPLGLFRMAGAVSSLPKDGGLPPSEGINYSYFTGDNGFARAMADVANPKGVVWIDGVCTVRDETGQERLVGHFSRREGLGEQYEQGMMVYNDACEIFEVETRLPLDEHWRFPCGGAKPVRQQDQGTEYLVFGLTFPVTRVPATFSAVMNPKSYQSWSCIDLDQHPETATPRRDANGALDWRWQAGPPVTQEQEARWLKAGLIRPEETRFLPKEAANPSRRVQMHRGSVCWNAYRKRWVLIANEIRLEKDSPSMLGEVWYCESDSPQGPFSQAVQIATHDKQTFYNPRHHPVFDEDGGRVIYFEGTYCNTFTNAPATPRYNYNQMMYRLDLDHPTLKAARETKIP